MSSEERPPSRLQEMPSWLIAQTATYAHRLLTDALAAADARGYHYRLLAALHEFGPTSQASLGRRTSIDRSDTVAMLNELAERGLVKRSPDPVDRRQNVVTITPRGTEQFQRLDAILAQVQSDLLAPLSAADRRLLSSLLSRVLAYHADQ